MLMETLFFPVTHSTTAVIWMSDLEAKLYNFKQEIWNVSLAV